MGTLNLSSSVSLTPNNIFGPCFAAQAATATSLSANTVTKITLDSELFDTDGCFTSSRFTPTVAGYYQINATVRADLSSQTALHIYFYKNGSEYAIGNFTNTTSTQAATVGSTLAYMNGSTDYMELYCYSSVTGNAYAGYSTMFSAALIRPA